MINAPEKLISQRSVLSAAVGQMGPFMEEWAKRSKVPDQLGMPRNAHFPVPLFTLPHVIPSFRVFSRFPKLYYWVKVMVN